MAKQIKADPEKLREPITIHRYNQSLKTEDGIAKPGYDPVPLFKTKAQFIDISGGENEDAEGKVNTVKKTLYILRSRSLVPKEKDQLIHDGAAHNILFVQPVPEQPEYLQIICEVVAVGTI